MTLATATLAERIRTARTLAGLSQEDLAAKGLGILSVSRWERGKSIPRVRNLGALSRALGVSILWLTTGTGPGPTDVPVSEA